MTGRQIRTLTRGIHLIGGVLIAVYIYMPANGQSEFYRGFVQFVILPLISISGLVLWQLPRINKLRHQIRRAA
jgi:hypothetical protein